jgi:uncharacterized protein YecE (DUF72 family)
MISMTEYRIGAGGWAYFQVPSMDPLSTYARAFNFVEVNSTFYETPPLKQVASWREKVPEDFEFSVRCHKSLTHEYRLQPVKESQKVLSDAIDICKTLRATILQIQTPPSFKVTQAKTQDIRDLFASSNIKRIRVAWEIRQPEAKQLPEYLTRLMQDLNMVHCVDISKEDPAFITDIMYTRLFGKGKHNIYQFDDKELKQIHEKIKKGKEKKVVLSFHGLKMYVDAARFKIYNESNKMPSITSSVGLSSLKEVLGQDSKFPATKEQLIEHQGWKVFDVNSTERIHTSVVLERLPNQTYRNVDEVIEALRDKL